MSSLGKQTRLKHIFSHPSGRILAIAVDHVINYAGGMPEGLKRMGATLEKIVAGRPNSITMNKGIALRFMPRFAGQVPFIVQQVAVRPDDKCFAVHAGVEEVAAMGADAIAVSICVKGETESRQIEHLGSVVREAERCGLPVVSHVYPVGAEGESNVSSMPDDIFYAVRIGLEMGVDVIKVPYTGDVASFADIVSVTPVPVVTAGGPKCENLAETVAMVRDVVRSGAAGATVGRNAWGFADTTGAVASLKAAILGEH